MYQTLKVWEDSLKEQSPTYPKWRFLNLKNENMMNNFKKEIFFFLLTHILNEYNRNNFSHFILGGES